MYKAQLQGKKMLFTLGYVLENAKEKHYTKLL